MVLVKKFTSADFYTLQCYDRALHFARAAGAVHVAYFELSSFHIDTLLMIYRIISDILTSLMIILQSSSATVN